MSADGDSAAPRLVPSRPVCCRIIGLEKATAEIRIVRLAIVAGGAFRFAAGQYARVSFAECRPRALSMAGRPDAPALEFHVRHGGGGVGANAARHLRPGDVVWVQGPYGDAWLRARHRGPILAIAGGTGIAPLKSIVESALHADAGRDIRLYFGARDEGDIYLEQHFCTLAERHRNFRWVPVLSQPSAQTARRVGMVTDAVAADAGDLTGTKAYVAGPPPMVGAAVALLLANGIAACDIHADTLSAGAATADPMRSEPAAQAG